MKAFATPVSTESKANYSASQLNLANAEGVSRRAFPPSDQVFKYGGSIEML